jgi:hypothetical protein
MKSFIVRTVLVFRLLQATFLKQTSSCCKVVPTADSTHIQRSIALFTCHYCFIMLLAITPEEWLVLGLQTVGFDPIRQNGRHETNIERYVSHFGASPQSHSAIFSDLQTTQNKAAQITKPSVLPFLMAMYWLKTYQSESVMAGTFKVDEKTVRTYVWKYVLAIQALKEQKVNAKWKS